MGSGVNEEAAGRAGRRAGVGVETGGGAGVGMDTPRCLLREVIEMDDEAITVRLVYLLKKTL